MKKILLSVMTLLFIATVLHAAETQQQRDISNCERIGLPEWRDDCFETLNKTINDYSLCLKISELYRRDKCIANHPPKSQADCSAHKDARSADACLMHLKEATQDIAVCNKVSDLKMKRSCYACNTNPKDSTVCLQFRAKQLQDPSLCDLIDTKTAKNDCLAGIKTQIPVVGCEQPQSLQEYKLCKQFDLAQKEEMKSSQKSAKIIKKEALNKSKADQAKAKAAKLQQAKDERSAKLKEKADKLQHEKDAKAEAKAAKIKNEKNAKDAKAQAAAAKIQQAKDAKAAKAQEKATKIQQEKDAKAAKIQSIKDAKAAKLQAKVSKASVTKQAPVVNNNLSSSATSEKVIVSEIKTAQKTEIKKSKPAIANELDSNKSSQLDIVKKGCTAGFGGWVVPPKSQKDEQACDAANVKEFETVLNHCVSDKIDPKILLYDLDNDGCVTCKDFEQWKSEIADLYKTKRRSTDGKSLTVKQCQAKK